MYREESREAFVMISNKDRKRQQVYEAIMQLGRCTDREIAAFLNWEINRITPRRGELVEMGKVVPVGRKKQNERTVNIWQITKPQLTLF